MSYTTETTFVMSPLQKCVQHTAVNYTEVRILLQLFLLLGISLHWLKT